MKITAFDLAQRFIGIKEVKGNVDNPQILSMLKLVAKWPGHDEVPWCSAFINYICWLLRLPRSKSLRARSWLEVGQPITNTPYMPAKIGFDVVILWRTSVNSPNGHVGFYAGKEGDNLIYLLGGNQSDGVNIQGYDAGRVLGIRRLYNEDMC